MNLQSMKLREYLGATRRHLCIVGKFTDEKDPERRIISKQFPDAHRGFKFELYYREHEIEFDEGTKMRTVKILFPREILALSDKEREGVKEIVLPESLRVKLRGAKADPAEVGGTLFVELLEGLDAMLPFSHPNFDRLLTMAMIEYVHAGMREAYAQMTRGVIADLLQRPDVNQRLIAYLRGDSRESGEGDRIRKAQLDAFGRTLEETARRGEAGVSLGERGSDGGQSRVDQLEKLVESFRAGLANEPGISGDADRVDGVIGGREFSHSVPREAESARDPARAGRERRTRVEEGPARRRVRARDVPHVPRRPRAGACAGELRAPAHPGVVLGATQVRGDPGCHGGVDWTRVLRDRRPGGKGHDDPHGRSDRSDPDERDELDRELRYENVNQQAVANSAKHRVLEVMEREIAWTHRYNWWQFKHDAVEIFGELVMIRLPGRKELLDGVDVESFEVCEAFMAYQTKLRNAEGTEEVTSETLESS